jgi:hypothetical protein
MRTYNGGETVKGGYFLNTRDWKIEVLEGDTGVLPGEDAIRYRRVPMLAMIALAPTLGFLFVILLPFIGLAVIGEQLYRKLAGVRVAPAEAAKPATTPRR